MKQFALILFTFFFFSISYAQSYTVNGMVKDAKTNDPVIGAAVFELGDATVGTATDTEGFFSLHFEKSHILLKIAYIGYRDTVFDIRLKNDTALIVNLFSETDISEVEVEDDSINWKPQGDTLSGNYKKIYADGADKKDNFTPAPYVIVKNKPVKKSLNEIYYGGNNGAFGKAVFIDGARIFLPEQQTKLLSLIDINSVGDYTFYNSYFPAEYGGISAPVLDIRMKEGNMQNYKGSINFNFFGAGISAEGPVIENNSSFFISARKTYLNNPYTELFVKDNSLNEEYRLQPSFWDINLKYVHKINDKNRFFASFFHNSDRINTETSENIDSLPNISLNYIRNINSTYGNTATTFNFEHIFTNNFSFNTALILSRYNLRQNFSGDSLGITDEANSYINRYNATYTSGIEDITLKLYGKYTINQEHFLIFGTDVVDHHFRPVKAELRINDFEHPVNIDTSWEASTVNTQEYAVYVRDKFVYGDRLTINGGLRFSAFVNSGTNYFSLEPGFSATYELFNFLSLNAAYNLKKEYIHLLTDNSGLPSNVFIPSSEDILPQVTNHIAAGAKLELPFKIHLNGTVFYDIISDFYDYKDNFSFFNFPSELVLTGMNLEERIVPASGNYAGIRTTLSKTYKNFSVNIGHTISDFTLKSDSINFGQTYQYTNNHRNEFNLKLSYRMNENIKIFAEWYYRSGNFITVQKQHYIPYEYNNGRLGTGNSLAYPTNYLNEYTLTPPFNRNSFQIPAYHRLDIGAEYILENHTFGIHIYNVYNRNNPDLIDYKKSIFTNSTANQLVKFGSLPFFPTISYAYKF